MEPAPDTDTMVTTSLALRLLRGEFRRDTTPSLLDFLAGKIPRTPWSLPRPMTAAPVTGTGTRLRNTAPASHRGAATQAEAAPVLQPGAPKLTMLPSGTAPDTRLLGLVRILARCAAREWYAHLVEAPDPTRAPDGEVPI